jgi:hypothetical protein
MEGTDGLWSAWQVDLIRSALIVREKVEGWVVLCRT